MVPILGWPSHWKELSDEAKEETPRITDPLAVSGFQEEEAMGKGNLSLKPQMRVNRMR